MTWTRLGDDFTDRPDVAGLSDGAFRAHIEALVWCNRLMRDGVIPRSSLRRILTSTDVDSLVDELAAAGLWTVDDKTIQLDWSEQEPAERVAERRAEWRRRDERRRRHINGDHTMCDAKRCHYLIANPDALTRETTGDTRRDSHPPVPLPSRSRPLGRERERESADARSAGAPRAPRSEEENRPRGFTFKMPDGYKGA